MNEELMASHLEHLKLSPESRLTDHSPAPAATATDNGVGSGPHNQLSITTVASCPHSMECQQLGRKRPLSESHCDDFMEISRGHSNSNSVQSHKKRRLNIESKMPSENLLRSTNEVKTKHVTHSIDTLCGSVLSTGSVSDLSSIPEETEQSRVCSTPDASTENAANKEEERLILSSPQSPLSLSSTYPSLSPFPLPPVSDADHISELRSVWIAPELQDFSTLSDCPLPVSIVKEMYVLRCVLRWLSC